jgi:hypothetical protein
VGTIERRSVPPLHWRAVLAGLAVAVVVALVARSFLAPIPGVAATIIGVGLGGFVAGKWAKTGGLYHGAVVGMGWIALEALGAVPTASYASDVLADTVIVIALDVVTLLAGSIGGWLARPDPSSSSGTGRGR